MSTAAAAFGKTSTLPLIVQSTSEKVMKIVNVTSTENENRIATIRTTEIDFISPSYLDLRTAFDLLDRDQDGMVTPTELQFMLRNLGIEMSDELIDGLMKEASKTGEFEMG
jgi:Ca2+-binding EF-hand superfamily protein